MSSVVLNAVIHCLKITQLAAGVTNISDAGIAGAPGFKQILGRLSMIVDSIAVNTKQLVRTAVVAAVLYKR
jgi:hypothetical protein